MKLNWFYKFEWFYNISNHKLRYKFRRWKKVYHITCNCFFTSYNLAEKLLDRKLTILKTLREYRSQIPVDLLEKSMISFSFAFNSIMAPTFRKKKVILLSTNNNKIETWFKEEETQDNYALKYIKGWFSGWNGFSLYFQTSDLEKAYSHISLEKAYFIIRLINLVSMLIFFTVTTIQTGNKRWQFKDGYFWKISPWNWLSHRA